MKTLSFLPRNAVAMAVAVMILAFGYFAVTTSSGADTEDAVTIDNFTFRPGDMTVAVGTKLTWLNRDDIPHVVVSTSGPKSFRSKPLDTGDGFSVTFDQAGIYKYFCSLHPKMVGTVTVR